MQILNKPVQMPLRSKVGQQGRLFVAAMAAMALQPAIAQTGAPSADEEIEEARRYAVEVIIFRNLDTNSSEVYVPDRSAGNDNLIFGDERVGADADSIPGLRAEFPADTQSPDPSNEAEALREMRDPGLQILSDSEEWPTELDETYGRLQRLQAYQPIFRTAWIQSTFEKEQSLPINLRRLGDLPRTLTGTATLYLNRFLHLDLDLALEDPSAQRLPPDSNRLGNAGDSRSNRPLFGAGSVNPKIVYRIQEDRIFRNGELRYFDHPKFGVLAKIVRIEDATP